MKNASDIFRGWPDGSEFAGELSVGDAMANLKRAVSDAQSVFFRDGVYERLCDSLCDLERLIEREQGK